VNEADLRDEKEFIESIKHFAGERHEKYKPIYDYIFKSEALSLDEGRLIKYFKRF
jgi:DNA-binding ferritin-like protein (Dps family)